MFEESLFEIEDCEMRVELDKKSLFALASDTRVEILRSLQPMRRTVSQLSESLDIDKAAVHRHLKKMEEGGLVTRYEEHGFVYYGLSWKARDLLVPNENTKIVVLLSATGILVGILAFLLAFAFLAQSGAVPSSDKESGAGYQQRTDTMLRADDSGLTVLGYVLVFSLGAAATGAGVTGFRKYRRPRQRHPDTAKAVEGGRETLGDD